MLAMVAILVLKTHRRVELPREDSPVHAMTHRTPPGRQPQNDGLLSFRSSWKDSRVQSPTWAYPASSPVANFASTSISSMSSRGSWSSLFNTNNVRHLIGSSFDPTRDGGHGEPTAHEGGGLAGIPVPGNRSQKFSDIDSPRPRPSKSDSPQPLSPTSRADVSAARSLGSVAPPMAGQGRRPTFSQVAKARHTIVHKSVVVVDLQHELEQERESESELLYSFASSEQLVMHVLAYAEVLFRWKLLHKRIELLKAVDPFLRLPSDSYFNSDHSQLGVSILCTQCGQSTASRTQSSCSACGTRLGMPRCSVCRLPVKGLSFNCLGCRHVSHLSCWRSRRSTTCSTGCSCRCRAIVQA